MTREEALQEARSVSTDAKRLHELSKDYYASPDIITALLQNPNSPLALLSTLSKQAPLALLQNASLHLFFLEDAGFMRAFPAEVLIALVQESSTPMWLVEACCIAHRPSKDSARWAPFTQSKARTLFYAAMAKRRQLSTFLLEELSICENNKALAVYLRRADVPTHCVERLLCSPSQGIRSLAARHPNAPKELLSLIRRAGASTWLERYQDPNPKVAPDELAALLSKGKFLAGLALRHPNFPPEQLQEALTEPEQLVHALQNPNAPTAFLVRFSQSHKLFVAKHPNTPPETLRSLLLNGEHREQALQNPSSPQDLVSLIKRVESKDLSVAESELRALAQESDAMKMLALSHPNVSGAWLFELWRSYLPMRVGTTTPQESNELQLLSTHPSASAPMLAEIVGMKSEAIQGRASYQLAKRNALMHRNLSLGSIDIFIREVEVAPYLNHKLVPALLQNPKLQRTHAERLAEILLRTSGAALSKRALLRHPLLASKELTRFVLASRSLRELVAQHPNTSPKDLQRLAEDPEPNIRFYAARNPNTPRGFVQSLIECGATPDLFAISCREVALSQEQLRALMSRGAFARMLAARACKEAMLLDALLRDKHPRVRESAMMNPLLPSEKREMLWSSYNYYAKAALAQNPNATHEELQADNNRFRDGDHLLHRALATHPNTAKERLRALSSLAPFARDVAHNPDAPDDTLRQLAQSKSLEVRRAVAVNPSTPKELLPKLLSRPLAFPLETARLRIEISSSSPEASFSSELLLREAARPGARVYLIYRKAPLTVRPWLRKNALAHAGDELIAGAYSVDTNATPSILIDLRYQHQGLEEEAMLAITRALRSAGLSGGEDPAAP